MQKTKALVLRTVRYSDSRIIVSLFTEQHGMVSTIVRVQHGTGKGARTALWQLLNFVEVNVAYRQASDFQKVTEPIIYNPWKELPYHPLKAGVSMFLADFLYHSIRNEGANQLLFDFLEKALTWFDETENGIADFHLLLMAKMTRFLGIWPSTDGYVQGAVYDLKGACFVTQLPGHGQYLESSDAALFSRLFEADFSSVCLLGISRNERRHMLDVLLRYYQIHVPGFGELQSVDVLRELFS